MTLSTARLNAPRFADAQLQALYDAVCAASGLDDADLSGRRQHQRYVAARVAFSVLARGQAHTYEVIGNALCRDHTTIISLMRQFSKQPDRATNVRAMRIIEEVLRTQGGK